MTRTRRLELLVVTVVALLVLAGAAVALRGPSDSSSSHPTTSAQPVATVFAQSYLRYLDGSGSTAQLLDATPRVRSVIASAGPMPAGGREGALHVSSLRLTAVAQAPQGAAVLTAANRTLTLHTTFELSYVGGRWRVSSIIVPDFDTLLASAPRPVVPAALRRVATEFAVAYADWRLAGGPRPRGVSPTLAAQLDARQDPLAGRAGHGTVALHALTVLPQGSVASAVATVDQRGRTTRFSFNLSRAPTGWRAWEFPEASS